MKWDEILAELKKLKPTDLGFGKYFVIDGGRPEWNDGSACDYNAYVWSGNEPLPEDFLEDFSINVGEEEFPKNWTNQGWVTGFTALVLEKITKSGRSYYGPDGLIKYEAD